MKAVEEEKRRIRAAMRNLLAGLTPEWQRDASRRLASTIRSHPAWQAARCVAAFHPLPGEPQIGTLFEGPAPRRLLPRITGKDLIFHVIEDEAGLRRGPHGTREPDPERAPEAEPDEVDVCLVPGLAFTPAGGRLGRGGGFYDRFLRSLPEGTVTIGVCFQAQLLPSLPWAPWDLPVASVATEDGWATPEPG